MISSIQNHQPLPYVSPELAFIVRQGWTTFPIRPMNPDGSCACSDATCKDAGKHPAIKWGRLSLGAGTQSQIPVGCGIGLATGARSDCLVVDLDRKNGVDGLVALIELAAAAGGEIPETLTVHTPTGGFHLYFKHPGVKITNSASVLGPGIDIRCDGGYAVLPPSLHKCGYRYTYRDPYAQIVDVPPWLLDLLLNPPKKPRKITRATLEKLAKKWKRAKNTSKQEVGEILQKVCDGESFALPGERDTTLFHLLCALAEEYPNAEPDTLAGLFAPSLDLMASEEPGAPTVDDVLEKFTRIVGETADEEHVGPQILVTADMEKITNQAEIALARAGGLYRRGDAIVWEVLDADPPPEISREAGTPTIKIVPPAAVREKLSTGARWISGEESRTLPPTWVVETLMARKTWPKLDPLEAITETPVLRPGGTILSLPGYDKPTGILCRLNATYPLIVDGPTAQDIKNAIMTIHDAISTFQFEAMAHMTGFFAAILTPLARSAFKGPAPLFLFDSPTPGSGKGKLAKIAAIIATGRFPASATFPGEEEERRKAITTYAIEGCRIVNFDNVVGRLGGAALCKALTEEIWSDRVLGLSRWWSGPMNTIFFATANNAQLGADMDRRGVNIRIDPGVENPERLVFAPRFVGNESFANIVDYVRRIQPTLTAAALTILRGYIAAGRPPQEYAAWGSYEEWAKLVIGALRFAGFPDLSEARDALEDKDPDHENRQALVEGWAQVCADLKKTGMTTSDAIKTIYPKSMWERPYPRLAEALEALMRLQRQEAPTSDKLGWVLRGMAGRVFGGRKLIAIATSHHAKVWGVQ